jgi:hypothetical protein
MVRTISVRVGSTQDRSSLTPGSYEPDDSTTGVPSGVSLTSLAGNQVITTPGTTLYRRDITGTVDVRTYDVTIRECLIRGDGVTGTSRGLVNATNSACVNLLVEDCSLIADPPSSYNFTGILGHDYTARRNRIKDTCDGFGVFETGAPGTASLVTIEANYTGPLGWWRAGVDGNHADGSHNDSVQLQGGIGTVVRYNRFHGFNSLTVGNGATDGGRAGLDQTQCLSNLMMNANVGDPYDVEFYENWLYGGEVSVNVSDDNLGVTGQTIAAIKRNRFDRDQYLVPLLYQSTATWDIPASGDDKNYYMDNGAAIPLQTG